jgi:PAS domain S-box-containing protein
MDYQDKSKEELISELQSQKLELDALKEIEEKYNGLIENINDVIFSVDNQGIITFVSPSVIKLLGYSQKEIVGNNFSHFVGSSSEVLQNMFHEIQEKVELKNEYRILSRSGEPHWIRISSKAQIQDGWFMGATGTMIDITEQKLAEEELRKSEEQYRKLVETIDEVIYEIDVNGKIIFVGPSIYRILGYTSEEIIGRNFLQFVEQSPEYLRHRLLKIHDKSESQNEYQILAKSGEPHWIRFSSKAINKGGQFIGVTGTLIDITETKRVELELQKSESLYRSILTASPDTILISDLEGNVLFTSPMALKMFGFEETGFPLNRSLFDFLDPKDHNKAREAIGQMFDGLFMGATEYFGIKADGSNFEMEVNVEFIRDAEEKPTSMVFIVRDISDRKTVENKLIRSEEQYRKLVESVNDVIYEIDSSGIIKYTSPSVINVLGYTVDEVVGRNLFEFIFPEDLPDIMEKLKQLSERDYNFLEYRYIRKNGSIHWVQSSTSAIMDNGVMVGGTGILTDITERKLAEESLYMSEEKYRNIFLSAQEGIFQTYIDGTYLSVNPALAKMYGYDSPEELIKSRTNISTDSYFDASERNNFLRMMDIHGFVKGYEYEVKHKDGHKIWFYEDAKAVKDSNGKIQYFEGFVIDITERKLVEQQLQQNEQKYKALFYDSPLGYLIIQDGKFSDCNKVSETLMGGDRSAIVGKTPDEISPEYQPNGRKSIEYAEELINKAFKEGNVSFEWVHKRVDETEFLARIELSFIEYEGNKILLISWLDISSQREAEQKLRESEEQFRMVFENVFDGISIFEEDPDPQNRRLIDCNEQFATMAGRSRKELLEIGFTYSLTKTLEEDANHARLKGISEHFAYHGSFAWIRPDRKDNTIEYIARPIIWHGKSYSIGIDRDITEYKQKEDQLRKLSQAVEQSPVSIVITDLDGNIEYANPQACETTGYSLDELKGKNPRVLKSGETAIDEYQFLWNSIISGNVWKGIFHNKRKNGELYWESSQITPITDANGKIINYLALKEDITEWKKIQEELTLSEERFRQIAEHSQTLLWEVDVNGLYTFVSPVSKTVWGYEPDKLVGKKHFYDLHPIENREEFKESALQAFAQKAAFQGLINPIVTQSQKLVWVSTNGTPITDSQNNLIGYRGADNDITEKKLAEEALKESEEALNFAQRIANMGSWSLDLTTNKLTWSKNYYHLLGLHPDSEGITNDHFIKMVHPDDTHKLDEKLQEIHQTKESTSLDFRLIMPDGQIKWIQNNIVPVYEGDNLVSLNGVNIDITEKKLTEEALRINETALNQAQEISKMSSWELNLITEKLTWSKNYYQMMGIPFGTEMKTEFFLERVHPDDRRLVDKYFNKLKQTKKPVTYDIRLLLKNDEYKWIQNNIIPVLEDNQLVGLKGVNIDITDKKLDEEKIKQQNERLAAIINALPDIIFVSDREGRYLECYNASSETLLYDEHKLIGSKVTDVFDEKTANLHISKINECIEQKQLITYEYSSSNNGLIQYFEARLVPLGDDKVLRFVRDFSDKKQKENELIKLSQAVEQSPVSIVITDLDANVVYVNPSFETTSGYSSAEVLGKNTNLLKSGKTDQHVYQDLWETIVQGKEWKGEWINKKKNEEFYWEEISITPIHNSSGEVTNYLAIKQDISQRKHAEQEILELNSSLENRIEKRTSELADTNLNLTKEIEFRKLTEQALAESEKSYRTVVENVNEVIFQTDPEGLWIFLNKSWEAVTGFSVNESLGQLFVNYVHPDDRARNWELFEPLIKREKDYCRHQLRYLTKGGGFRWIEVFARLGLNENDEITGTYGTLMDITDRKMAEELINQTRQNYETFFNTIDDFLWVLDEHGNIIHTNETVKKRLEYTENELLNQSVLIAHPIERREEAGRIVGEMMAGTTEFCPVPLITKSGKQIPVETRVKSGFWNGVPVIFGVSKDISQIKISEEKFASAFHSNSAIMTITRFDNDQFVDVNNAFINLLGYSREEIMGKTLTSLGIVEEIAEGKKIQSLIENGIPVHEVEINAYSKSNELFIFLLSAEEIYVGLERCILSIAVNITERKRAQEQLQWNKSLLEMMSNSSPLGFLVVDNRTDEILYFNKRFCQIWGIENIENQMLNGDLKNNDIIPYCLPVLLDIPAFAESCKPLQDENNRTVVSDEIPFSENRTIHRYTTQIRGLDDQYFGRFYIFEDITEEKQSKLELMNAKNEAERANLAKSEFLSRMSHELRTPMNSILGFAQLLEMGELNSRQSKGVNHIMKSGKHLLDLINEVLDISRIEAGRLSLSLEPVQLSGVIPEMIDIVKPQIIERQIRIEVAKSESNQMFVRSDRQRLKQILLNLLNNAIKYNQESGSIWIKTELRPVNELGVAMIRISITDSGLGISEEDLPKLFNPFERIGAERSATEGTGLGLSVVKKLIEAMSGKLGVESIPGIGSTFWIELPNSESPLENIEKSGILKELEPNLANLSGTILYIEDNASNIELVEQILTNQRSRIKLISNMTGTETVQMAIAYRPDLILLDLNLPDLHGSKVLSLLLAEEQTKNIPVVVISADAMPLQLERLLKGGARDYLTKPLDVQEFLMMIDKYIPQQE